MEAGRDDVFVLDCPSCDSSLAILQEHAYDFLSEQWKADGKTGPPRSNRPRDDVLCRASIIRPRHAGFVPRLRRESRRDGRAELAPEPGVGPSSRRPRPPLTPACLLQTMCLWRAASASRRRLRPTRAV
jgi:hypothetical protein